MDSVEIATDKRVGGKKKYNWEVKRRQMGSSKTFHKNLRKKAKKLKKSKEFTEFVKKTTKWKVADRITAKEALEDKFLELTGGEEKEAKKLLADLLE